MKVVLVICAVTVAVSAGPGVTVVTSPTATFNTPSPGQTKFLGLLTAQYINALLTAQNYQTQYSYQVPLPTYYPSTVYYPQFQQTLPAVPFPSVPIAIEQPIQPAKPEQPAVVPSQPTEDSVNTVVDSTDFSQQNNEDQNEQTPSTEAPKEDKLSTP